MASIITAVPSGPKNRTDPSRQHNPQLTYLLDLSEEEYGQVSQLWISTRTVLWRPWLALVVGT